MIHQYSHFFSIPTNLGVYYVATPFKANNSLALTDSSLKKIYRGKDMQTKA